MTGAVVVAAGMSRRMGTCKPLLPFGGGTMIESTVHRLIDGGVENITVVTGNQANAVEQALTGLPVQFVHNADFATTEMLDSVRFGLYRCRDCDAVFLIPTDIPQFYSETLTTLLRCGVKTGAAAVYPCVNGKNGHPLLLRGSAIQKILHYRGDNGVKGALQRLSLVACPVSDAGCLVDADTPEDYQRLLRLRGQCVPAQYEMDALYAYFGTDERIHRHCRAVCEKAKELAALPACEGLDKTLLAAAALVHDAARTHPQHAARVAQALLSIGYSRMAEVVSVHMALPQQLWDTVCEESVLYLADKLVVEDKPVQLEERFCRALQKCKGNESARHAIEIRKQAALCVLKQIGGEHV